jgi:hypothetical protein
LPDETEAPALPDCGTDRRVAVDRREDGGEVLVEPEVVADELRIRPGKREKASLLPYPDGPAVDDALPPPSAFSQRKACPQESVRSRSNGWSGPSVIVVMAGGTGR